jgi:hypothetical protein
VNEARVGQTLGTIRRLLLVVMLLGIVGIETELLLIGHYEDVTQRKSEYRDARRDSVGARRRQPNGTGIR